MGLEPGAMVGPFRLEHLLGKGGMGAVYAARHATGAEVALKVLLVEDPEEGPILLERFKREVSAMARVGRHPNLVRVHTAGTHGALPYVVMELVPGRDLGRKIGGSPMDPTVAARTVEKVARAVHHCHEQGVIHRDLKPANVLLREDGEPVVTDFGLAREDAAQRLTKTGELMGTPSYMAPEQVEGKRDQQDRRTDVYALGAILYECLTGEPPFGADSKAALVKQILLEDPVSAKKKAPAVPDDLAVIAAKCLEKERIARYPSALELAEELGRFLRGEPIKARPLTSGERRRRWLKRHRREAALGVVAALILLLGGAGALGIALASKARNERRDARILAINELCDETRTLAVAEGFPALPRDATPKLREKLGLVCEARLEVAPIVSAQVLLRWADLVLDATRSLVEPPPANQPVAQALDAVAALRLGDARLIDKVKERATGAEHALLVARSPLRSLDIVADYANLGAEERQVWADTFCSDCVKAFESVLGGAYPATPESAASLRQLVADARGAGPVAALPARLAALPGWSRLGDRVDLAVSFGQILGGAVATDLGNALAKTARDRLRSLAQRTTGIEGVVSDDTRKKLFEQCIAATNLGARLDPVEDLEPLFRTGTLDPEKTPHWERVYRFALYLEIGFTPEGATLALPHARSTEDKRRNAEAKKQAAIDLARNVPTPASELTFALVLFEAAFDLDPEMVGMPTADRDFYLGPALAALAAIRPRLTRTEAAVERFEYAYVLCRLRNSFAGFRETPSPNDPVVVTEVEKALEAASDLHRKVDLMEAWDDAAKRRLWRAFDEAKPAVADAACKKELEALDRWEEETVKFVAAGDELQRLDERSLSYAQKLARFEFGYCDTKTIAASGLSVAVDIGIRRHTAHAAVAGTHLKVGDQVGARPHYQAALDELDKLVKRGLGKKDRASEVQKDRGLMLLQLGQPEKALEAGHLALDLADEPFDQVKGNLTVARALKALGRIDEARVAAQESLRIAKTNGKGPQDWSESQELVETLK